MTPTDEKPMTVDALMDLAQQLALAHFNPSLAPTTLDEYRRSFRTAIEQYGREQGFESTAQRDVREACYELRDALGNPVISGTGYQTIQGQTIRMAAARLRGSSEPVAWIQPDHLQKARVAPFLCRVEPTKRCSDFVPIYTARQSREC